MKVSIFASTLTFLICVTIPQCLGSTSELQLKNLLKEILQTKETRNFKEIPNIPTVPELNNDNDLRKQQTRASRQDREACGDTAALLTEASGTIDFPTGNGKYPAWSDCAWAIYGGTGNPVTVTFTYIQIEKDRPCDDYVRIYSMRNGRGDDFEFSPLTDKICPSRLSEMRPKVFTTSSNDIAMYIELKSDWWDNKRGFILNYSIQQSRPTPAPPTGGNGGNGGNGGAIVPGGSDDVSDLTCNFDRRSLCGWKNIRSDDLDWKVQKGSESEWRTWGKQDHTTGGSSGAYAYMDASEDRRGQNGIMTSDTLSAGPRGGRCLTFYYNMLQTDGTFKVTMQYQGGGSQTILQRDGGQGNGWLKATVSLISNKPYKIQFEHTRGSMSVETGLAIDDINMSTQQCPSRLNSCGTNIYGSRKRRDLRSLLKSLLEVEKEQEVEELQTRILGGQQSRKGEFPWIVHIRIFSQGIESGRYSQCGGSIIDDEWILTAAHCFESGSSTITEPSKVRIYLGEHNTHYNEVEESQFVLIPERVVIHKDRNINAYGLRAHQYDITLLKLKYKLTFTDDVNAVCLPDQPFRVDTRCEAAGWGLAEHGDSSDKLLHLSKLIQNDNDCQPYSITEDMICAIAPLGTGDVCQGDSGGPLVCKRSNKYELAGAVSFGDACANRDRTSGVYADIYYFMPWIKSTIN